MKKLLPLLLLPSLIFISCYTRTVKVYSPNKKQIISVYSNTFEMEATVFELDDNSKPKNVGHVYFDVSEVDPLAQALFVCWEKSDFKISIRCPEAVISENTLDSTKYKILTVYDVDDQGIPTAARYHSDGCFELTITEGNVDLMGDGTLED